MWQCSSFKTKQPVFLNVLVFMSFSSVLLERQLKPHCCRLPQLRTQTALLCATAKDTNRIALSQLRTLLGEFLVSLMVYL